MTPAKHIVTYISAHPARIFWAFALAHLVLWTLIPSLVCQNLPLDVIEGYAWGNEWLLGTYKHPPMQAWVLEFLYDITGRAKWAPYLASQVAIITAFWAVWRTGRRIAGEVEGLIGALLLEGIIYYNFTSPEFNPNVLQLPFWALIGWSFYKAVKHDKTIDWLLLGLWAAAGLYTKYSTGLMLLVLFFSMCAHRDGRRRFTSPGPYLAFATAALLFLPHLLWLIHNNFIPFDYATGRLERNSSNYSAAITTTLLVAGQLIALTFMILLFIVLYDRRRAPSRTPTPSFDRTFLCFAAFGPFLFTFLMSLVLGYHIRDMWETPFWNFIGLWVVVMLRPSLMPHDINRLTTAWVFTFVMGLVIFVSSEVLAPYATSKGKRTNFPGKHLSHAIEDGWHEQFHTPLRYVVGDTWPAGNVAWYSEDRPHVFMDGDSKISPWINLPDLKKSGGVLVWCIKCDGKTLKENSIPDTLHAEFPTASLQEPLTLQRMTFANIPPAIVGWAIVAPEKEP